LTFIQEHLIFEPQKLPPGVNVIFAYQMTKLKYSKTYLLIPIVFIVFIFIFYLVYENIKQRTISEFKNEQLILAGTASQGIGSFFKEYQSNLAFLSQFNDVIDFTGKGQALMASFYENHKNFIEAVTRVDAHGVILYTYPENVSVVGKDISYQKHVQQVMDTHQPVISDVFVSEQGYRAIALHVPVFKGKAYTGSLAMLIPVNKLGKQYLGKIRIRGTGNICLLSEKGVKLYCTVRKAEETNPLVNGTAALLNRRVLADGFNTQAKEDLISYRVPIRNTFWTILISYQKTDIYSALARLRNWLILIFSILVVASSYFFYSFTKVRDIGKDKEITMLAHALRSVNECVSITNVDDVILFVNEAFTRTYGYTEEELIGKNIGFLRSTDNSSAFVNEILPATLEGEWKGELLNRRKDGSEFPIYLSTTIIKDKNGNPLGLIGVASDISERLRKEKELIQAKEKAEESDRLKSKFLANMSHEIRTPMNGILGFAELLKEPDLTSDDQQEYIEIIEKSGARMLTIINDIVDISKIESGQMEVVIADTNVNEQIECVYDFFKDEAEKKGMLIFFKNSLPSKNSVIRTDRDKIFSILKNLIGNAIKYSLSKSIEFGYDKKDNWLEFYVKDRGVGIHHEKREIIFTRFRQGGDLTNQFAEGTGLGLSIAKAYVELLGGKIWVESEIGKGSIFYFTIPYNPEPRENITANPFTKSIKLTKSVTSLRKRPAANVS